MSTTPPAMLETILNLSRYHREHEKFYAQAPLEQAISLQRWSRSIKALADRWVEAESVTAPLPNRYAGCEDLNDDAAIDGSGILFLEGEGEPAEIGRMKRELAGVADDFASVGSWLAEAMTASLASAEALVSQAPLADMLGERHRIIANDWQAAGLNSLVSHLLQRSVALLEQIDFSPAALRADLADARSAPRYLFSASELIDHAADLVTESAVLVHDNERRWRVFHASVASIVDDHADE